jgi:hypothetical protein
VTFLTVYIKEAHPSDEWQMTANEKQGVCYPQPRTLSQRIGIARDFVSRFGYDLPLVVDGMDNAADDRYAAWPERLYIVDKGGVIRYKGKTGPFGFDPEEVAAWLARTEGPPGPG